MPIPRLDKAARDSALAALPEWTLADDGKAITRKFVFADFSAAFGFITRVAMAAEKADHHPEWSNVWNRVAITLTTHDADGLSARDIALAGVLDQLAG